MNKTFDRYDPTPLRVRIEDWLRLECGIPIPVCTDPWEPSEKYRKRICDAVAHAGKWMTQITHPNGEVDVIIHEPEDCEIPH